MFLLVYQEQISGWCISIGMFLSSFRFEFNRFSMGKINKEVSYSEYLNLRPFMSETKVSWSLCWDVKGSFSGSKSHKIKK